MVKSKLDKIYETDASQVDGKLEEVFIPENLVDLQQIIRKFNNITPRGGGTGLAGGAVPLGGVVIDLSKLNKIIKFDKQRKQVEVEAGIILDEINDFLEKNGLEFPIQPSSHSACTVGGMIATDAVGSRAVKYGRTSRWVDWIEVVDNEGQSHRKGITDMADFAGLEGTTGIITKAGLRLIDKPERTATLIKVQTAEEAVNTIRDLKRNKSVSMAEFFGKEVSKLLGLGYFYHLLIEYESPEGNLIGEDHEKALELRDKIYPALAELGYYRIEDPKLFLDKIPELIHWLEHNKIPVYGHLSVGILHPCFSKEKEKLIPEMMKIVKKLNGQISGEHGIGILKKEFMDERDKQIFSLIKQRNDSGNKFNPGKIVK